MFSKEWVEKLAARWNSDPDMVEPLAKARFNSKIGFGFSEFADPSVVLEVAEGKVVWAGTFDPARHSSLDWDLRANPEQWVKWRQEGLGFMALGVAVSSKQLEFRAGDYRKMIRNPDLAAPFLKVFTLL